MWGLAHQFYGPALVGLHLTTLECSSWVSKKGSKLAATCRGKQEGETPRTLRGLVFYSGMMTRDAALKPSLPTVKPAFPSLSESRKVHKVRLGSLVSLLQEVPNYLQVMASFSIGAQLPRDWAILFYRC